MAAGEGVAVPSARGLGRDVGERRSFIRKAAGESNARLAFWWVELTCLGIRDPYPYKYRMKAEKKITVMLPEELLDRALKASGEGITPTLRKGLELVAAQDVYKELLKLKGKLEGIESAIDGLSDCAELHRRGCPLDFRRSGLPPFLEVRLEDRLTSPYRVWLMAKTRD